MKVKSVVLVLVGILVGGFLASVTPAARAQVGVLVPSPEQLRFRLVGDEPRERSVETFGGRGATYVHWTLSQSGDEMFITIGTWRGLLSGEHRRFVLKQFNSQWFVVGARGGGEA